MLVNRFETAGVSHEESLSSATQSLVSIIATNATMLYRFGAMVAAFATRSRVVCEQRLRETHSCPKSRDYIQGKSDHRKGRYE